MPFNKVCVDRLYQKTGSPNEKKARRVQQVADDIFADLFASRACREQNAPERTVAATRPPSPVFKKVSFALILMSAWAWHVRKSRWDRRKSWPLSWYKGIP